MSVQLLTPEEIKASGSTYTPEALAEFVAEQIVGQLSPKLGNVSVLDPAIGDGELLISLVKSLKERGVKGVNVFGYETNKGAIDLAEARLSKYLSKEKIKFDNSSFLEHALDHFQEDSSDLFSAKDSLQKYDLIIANPPYVRTQVMGAKESQSLADRFGLAGRVDLYHAFIMGMAYVLKPGGFAGIIVSNRFMTTKSGAEVRSQILKNFDVKAVWDLGDTKIFDVAVLPAVLLLQKKQPLCPDRKNRKINFTSIYQTENPAKKTVATVMDALSLKGTVEVEDGRRFLIKQGTLEHGEDDKGVWRVATKTVDSWLRKVQENTWKTFGEIGKIRVGVKTTADKVFIRSDWDKEATPELLKPLITHHIGGRYKASNSTDRFILYTHHSIDGKKQVVDIDKYPMAKKYLEENRERLEGRKYVIEAGRKWYEIWVPQDPALWERDKIVFRDISEEPMFWLDQSGAVVNGDCYWMINEHSEDNQLLWLALAIGNSKFIEEFYDHKFHNKLYAGRRRFITQYVQHFPVLDPQRAISKKIVKIARKVYERLPSQPIKDLEEELSALIYDAFDVPQKQH